MIFSNTIKQNNLKKDEVIIYGRHASLAALSNKNRFIKKILLSKNNKELENMVLTKIKHSEDKHLLEIVEKKSLDRIVGKNIKHQGILLVCIKLNKQKIEGELDINRYKIGVVLDKITDPNNVGAIYRSAVCFNIDFIINLERDSVRETGALLNAACGSFESINTFYTNNLYSCIKFFKKNNWWVLGTDLNADLNINSFFTIHNDIKKILIVLGSEGDGARRLTKEKCDFLVKIPIKENNSLNVSNAAAIFFYELKRNLKLY